MKKEIFKEIYNLRDEGERKRALNDLSSCFLRDMNANGVHLYGKSKCRIYESSINIFITNDDNKDAFGSGIDFSAKKDSTIFNSKNEINFGTCGSFTPKEIGSYWRSIHAANILRNWDVACKIVNDYCESYRNLLQAIKEVNNL